MAKVLVTGANGHIGASTVRCLIDEGHSVVALVRQGADTTGIDGLALQLATGDILDEASVQRAAEGCEYVIHHAAVYAMRGKTADEIIRPSVEGVANVLRAAKSQGVQRFVHTSSLAAVGYEDRADGKVRTAADWNTEARAPYYIAKTDAERRAVELADELSVPLVSLCPGGVLGAYDYRITPTTKLVLDMASGTGSSGAGGLGLVDVRDVALCHVRAMTRGPAGARYLVSGANASMRDVGSAVAARTGKSVPYLPMPRWMAPLVVPLIEAGAKLLGKSPMVTMDEAREVLGRWPTFDCSATESALGVQLRGLEECVDHALRWLVFMDRLPPKVATRVAAALPADSSWG